MRIAGRATQGVIIFRVDQAEKVVSVAALEDASGEGVEAPEGEEGGEVSE